MDNSTGLQVDTPLGTLSLYLSVDSTANELRRLPSLIAFVHGTISCEGLAFKSYDIALFFEYLPDKKSFKLKDNCIKKILPVSPESLFKKEKLTLEESLDAAEAHIHRLRQEEVSILERLEEGLSSALEDESFRSVLHKKFGSFLEESIDRINAVIFSLSKELVKKNGEVKRLKSVYKSYTRKLKDLYKVLVEENPEGQGEGKSCGHYLFLKIPSSIGEIDARMDFIFSTGEFYQEAGTYGDSGKTAQLELVVKNHRFEWNGEPCKLNLKVPVFDLTDFEPGPSNHLTAYWGKMTDPEKYSLLSKLLEEDIPKFLDQSSTYVKVSEWAKFRLEQSQQQVEACFAARKKEAKEDIEKIKAAIGDAEAMKGALFSFYESLYNSKGGVCGALHPSHSR